MAKLQAEGGIREEARLRNTLAGKMRPKLAYSTLFYGLKKNQVHNMAVVHPLTFVLRRVLYTVVILYFVGETALFGALLLLATCLVMMVFVVHEAQWESQLINSQHLVNECFFYLLCVSLVLFSGLVHESVQVQSLGWFMILCTCSMIIFNIIVILFDSIAFIRLLCQRHKLGLVRAAA